MSKIAYIISFFRLNGLHIFCKCVMIIVNKV